MNIATVSLALIPFFMTPVAAQNERFISITDYEFTAPQGWQVINRGNHFFIQSPASGCQILIFEPQPSSGNLEDDAQAVFGMMYPPTNWRYTQQGERKYVLSRGYLAKGLRYSMVKGSMNATTVDGQYHTEDGVALVIQAGSQIVIVSVRHTSLSSHWDCDNKYEMWPRFFNSFDIKSLAHPVDFDLDPAKRIVGVWKLATGGVASGEYVFAANGNFQFTGAVGTSSTTSDHYYKYIHITSYAFEGDGSYSFDGNMLVLKRRADAVPEQRQLRFEEVNHGDTGWRDRMYLLSHEPSPGGMSEVCYEKEPPK